MEKGREVIDLSAMMGVGDMLLPEVEDLLQAPKVAEEINGGKRKHAAPNEFRLRVKRASGRNPGLIVVARKGGGSWFITLVTEHGDVLRQYHYGYTGHGNPNGTITGRSHKHFPTRNCPLQWSHKGIKTWAYDPDPFPGDFVDDVKHFCEECNIVIQRLQERLQWRWFR